ncbi:MAG: hypothetical protein ACLGGX_03625 [Bdellovibrionia bacterium]
MIEIPNSLIGQFVDHFYEFKLRDNSELSELRDALCSNQISSKRIMLTGLLGQKKLSTMHFLLAIGMLFYPCAFII